MRPWPSGVVVPLLGAMDSPVSEAASAAGGSPTSPARLVSIAAAGRAAPASVQRFKAVTGRAILVDGDEARLTAHRADGLYPAKHRKRDGRMGAPFPSPGRMTRSTTRLRLLGVSGQGDQTWSAWRTTGVANTMARVLLGCAARLALDRGNRPVGDRPAPDRITHEACHAEYGDP